MTLEKSARAVGLGYLSVYAICASFFLSMVPGYAEWLIGPLGASIFANFFCQTLSSKKALSGCVALSLLAGVAVRKLAYESHGLTSGVFLAALAIFVVSVGCGNFVLRKESQSNKIEN